MQMLLKRCVYICRCCYKTESMDADMVGCKAVCIDADAVAQIVCMDADVVAKLCEYM